MTPLIPFDVDREESKALYNETLALVQSDPIAREYASRVMRAIEANRAEPLRDAVDVIGDQRLRALSLAKNAMDGQLRTVGDIPDVSAYQLMSGNTWFVANLVEQLMCAEAFLWMTEIRKQAAELAFKMSDVPLTVNPEIFGTTSIWWTFETAIVERTHERYHTEGVLFCTLAGVSCAVEIGTWGGFPESKGTFIRPLWCLSPGALIEEAKSSEVVRVFIGMQAFLNSPYIPKAAMSVARPMRRASAEATHQPVPAVRFVDLRSIASREHASANAADTDAAHMYSIRWIVRGHLRAQWYPSRGCHDVIYIHPHLKGPDDAPLVARAYRASR